MLWHMTLLDNHTDLDSQRVLEAFTTSRNNSMKLAKAFSAEDWMVQSMPDASPIKWNLAHTSWFYETFILKPFADGYRSYNSDFNFLFNSYYQQVGAMHPRPDRGLLSRPSAQEVEAYRCHVDDAAIALLNNADADLFAILKPLFELGRAHEEQHQELLLTDIKHALSLNPLAPILFEVEMPTSEAAIPLEWVSFDGGLVEIGNDKDSFAFDNEGPRHKTYIDDFSLANRPVTNGEYLQFIEAGGYHEASIWLADGWELVQAENWKAPLYWRKCSDGWFEYSLFGERPVNLAAPVCHLSFYEAAAFAEWTSYRLPTEFEWERAAETVSEAGQFMTDGVFEPPAPAQGEGLCQIFGSVWEWTASPYVAYPGYRSPEGAIGEYNGKFMSSQMVLRGGSVATPTGHARRTYRNFFPPRARWQFAGLRLARDV